MDLPVKEGLKNTCI